MAVALSQVQVAPEKGYSRSSIERYTADERRPLVDYLDSAKVEASKSMRLVTEGGMDQLYEAMLPAFRKLATLQEFRDAMNVLTDTYGRILLYYMEFRL